MYFLPPSAIVVCNLSFYTCMVDLRSTLFSQVRNPSIPQAQRQHLHSQIPRTTIKSKTLHLPTKNSGHRGVSINNSKDLLSSCICLFQTGFPFLSGCASVINTRPSFTWNAKFSSGWSWKLMAQVCQILESGNWYGNLRPWWTYFCKRECNLTIRFQWLGISHGGTHRKTMLQNP